MINEFTFSAVGPLTVALKQAKKRIEVVKNSPVDLLNRASYSPLTTDRGITDTEFFQNYPDSLKRDIITGDVEVVEFSNDGRLYKDIPVAQHETTFAELKRAMADSVIDLLSFCRTVVHPAVESIFQRFEDPVFLQSQEMWSIIPIPDPEFLDTALFETIIGKTPSGNLPSGVRSQRPKHIPETLEIKKTGHAIFDNTVADLMERLNTTPCEMMKYVWDEVTPAPGVQNGWELLPKEALALLLLIYFKDHPWEDSGISLTTWNDSFDTKVTIKSQWIRDYLSVVKFRCDNGLVVANYDTFAHKVYIYQNIWDDYISKGGTVESLHGALCRIEYQEAYDITTENLINDEQINVKTWESYHSVKEASNTAEWLNETRHRLTQAVVQWIDSVEDETIFPYNGYRENARRNISDYVTATLNVGTMKDATGYLIELLFDTVFTRVDGKRLMLNIHELVKDDVPIKNATYFAVRAYLENYVFSGLSVE